MGYRQLLGELRLLIGLGRNTTSHNEKLISALGALLGVVVVSAVTSWTHHQGIINTTSSYLVVASMGASAVLLFAVPQGILSQPWSLVAGNLLSAFIGVSCFKLLGNTMFSSALAVGASVGVMHYLRCIHPPGGATALTAVIGGTQVEALGYQFLLIPILVNVLSILLVAVLFNSLFSWRRYPAHLIHRHKANQQSLPPNRQTELTQEDFSAAIQELDSYIDISTESLTDLLELAKQHAERNITHPAEITAGKVYSNGKLGKLWSIRQVIDAAPHTQPSKDRVTYKILAGEKAYATAMCLRDEFRQWARYEVELRDNHWVKSTG